MRPRWRRFAVAVALFLPAPAVQAGGTSAGTVLLKSPSARALSFAEAVTSLGSDSEGVANFHYNPSASAFLPKPEASFLGQKGVADDSYGTVFFGFPTPRGTFAADAFYRSLGDIELIDSSGLSRTVSAQKDMGAGFNYAELLLDHLATGISMKFLNSKLVDSLSANAVAFDIGILARFNDQRLALGASALNMGSELSYLDTSEPLPLVLRAGASYRLGFRNFGSAIAALDIYKEKNDPAKVFLGLDYALNPLIAFRLGYKSGQDIGRISGGLGFGMGFWRIDYALTEAGALGQIHTVSTSFRFGREPSERKTRFGSDAPAAGYRRAVRPAADIAFKKSVAILNVVSQGVSLADALYLTDEIHAAFRRQDRYELVDRTELALFTRAKSRLESCNGLDCGLEIGRHFQAEKVVMSSLGQLGTIYVLSLRVLDAKSGKVEFAETVKSFSLKDLKPGLKDAIDSFLLQAQ